MAVTIREARCEDAEELTRVHIESWRTTYRGLLPDDYLANLNPEPRQRYWRSLLCAPQREQFVYVAVDDQLDQVIGFASGGKERSEDRDYRGELYTIYLLEGHQGQGIGRTLLRCVAVELFGSGFNSMLVWVLSANPSQRFYAALGGQPVRTQLVMIGEHSYEETGYGWSDISALLV